MQVLKWFYFVRNINNKIMGSFNALKTVSHNTQAAMLKVLRAQINITSGVGDKDHTLREDPLHFINSASRLTKASL